MKKIFCMTGGVLILSAVLTASAVTRVSADEPKKPSAELGKKLFSDPSLGTNGKSCATCHPSEEKAGELAARGTWFGGRAKTLEQAINFCITGPLDGKALPEKSIELKSIAEYMKSLTK